MKKLSYLIPKSAVILNQKQMSCVSGGIDQNEMNSPYSLAVFECLCKFGANPAYKNPWMASYATLNDALKDVDQRCINGAGECKRVR